MSRRFSCTILSPWLGGNRCSSLGISFLPERSFSLQIVKNTWVLKRQKQLQLTSLTGKKRRALRFNEMIYDYDPASNARDQTSPPLQVILTQNVPGHGMAGDVVMVRRNIARMFLLPEGKAQYVTPEGLAAFEARKKEEELHPERKASSATAISTVSYLDNMLLGVPMHMHNPWKLDKWHVRAALRVRGVWCPNDVLQLPDQEIVGPHPDMHGKCFSVFVTINGKERACLLCRIELRCKDPADALSLLPRGFKPTDFEELFSGAVSADNKAPTVEPRPPGQSRPKPAYLVKDF